MKIEKSNFTILPCGMGHYRASYRSPVTGKIWRCTVTDMEIVDKFKTCEYPTKKWLTWLKDYVKRKSKCDKYYRASC